MKIDLSKLPEGTKWIAIDFLGEVYAFPNEPGLVKFMREGFFAYEGSGLVKIGDCKEVPSGPSRTVGC